MVGIWQGSTVSLGKGGTLRSSHVLYHAQAESISRWGKLPLWAASMLCVDSGQQVSSRGDKEAAADEISPVF